jgi:hypothetical protein
MASSALGNQQTNDVNLEKIQANTRAATQASRSNPLNGGTILSGVSLSAGDNEIAHKLGKSLQGWFIVDINAASSVYKKSSNDKTITLNSSIACVVSLFVF